MISYEKHTLPNGLTVLLHEDHTTPFVAVNTLYRVGARDEEPQRTGFAHLFEHLMFGGTPRVPDYDTVVEGVGGESNAFTNNDYTNYYVVLPSQYIEVALQLESDRMSGIDFSPRSLQVQQQVVTEEYNQRYRNQPYGDVWMLFRPLCYTRHPYRWATIGSDIRHVQEATLEEVRAFFYRYYRPNNAILSIAGDIHSASVLELVQRCYGSIAPGAEVQCHLPQEPEQTAPRTCTVHRHVPADALYVGYHMPGRCHPDFKLYDLLSDILSNGQSSRLYRRLVQEEALFTELDAYVMGDADPGLFVVSGKLSSGVPAHEGYAAVQRQLQAVATQPLPQEELQKVKNKAESTAVFGQYKVLDRAMQLSYFESLGHVDWVNTEMETYRQVQPADVQRVAATCFREENSNVLYYLQQEPDIAPEP